MDLHQLLGRGPELGEPVEEVAACVSKRTIHKRQENQEQGGGSGHCHSRDTEAAIDSS